MDVGTASALNLYTFQTTAKSSGQPAALLQALTQFYNNAMASAGSDPMSNLLITANMAPVADAMSYLTNAGETGSGNSSADTLQAYGPFGGVTVASAAALFSTKSSSGSVSNSLSGFESALTTASAMALAAYQANLNFPTATNAPSPQASAFSSIVNLLG